MPEGRGFTATWGNQHSPKPGPCSKIETASPSCMRGKGRHSLESRPHLEGTNAIIANQTHSQRNSLIWPGWYVYLCLPYLDASEIVKRALAPKFGRTRSARAALVAPDIRPPLGLVHQCSPPATPSGTGGPAENGSDGGEAKPCVPAGWRAVLRAIPRIARNRPHPPRRRAGPASRVGNTASRPEATAVNGQRPSDIRPG